LASASLEKSVEEQSQYRAPTSPTQVPINGSSAFHSRLANLSSGWSGSTGMKPAVFFTIVWFHRYSGGGRRERRGGRK